jgi:hypothetical protein
MFVQMMAHKREGVIEQKLKLSQVKKEETEKYGEENEPSDMNKSQLLDEYSAH